MDLVSGRKRPVTNPRAEEIRQKRLRIRLSQHRLAELAGLVPWKIVHSENALRPDYTNEEYASLKAALDRYERAQREAERVLADR